MQPKVTNQGAQTDETTQLSKKAMAATPEYTVAVQETGWVIQGPAAEDIFAGLVIHIVYGESSERARERWQALPQETRNWLGSFFEAHRPNQQTRRLVLKPNVVTTLTTSAPKQMYLPRLGRVWVSEDMIVLRDVKCRSLREGDILVKGSWALRGHGQGRCSGTDCAQKLVRILKKSVRVSEKLKLYLTLERSRGNREGLVRIDRVYCGVTP